MLNWMRGGGEGGWQTDLYTPAGPTDAKLDEGGWGDGGGGVGGTGKQACTLQQDQLMLNWMGEGGVHYRGGGLVNRLVHSSRTN